MLFRVSSLRGAGKRQEYRIIRVILILFSVIVLSDYENFQEYSKEEQKEIGKFINRFNSFTEIKDLSPLVGGKALILSSLFSIVLFSLY